MAIVCNSLWQTDIFTCNCIKWEVFVNEQYVCCFCHSTVIQFYLHSFDPYHLPFLLKFPTYTQNIFYFDEIILISTCFFHTIDIKCKGKDTCH